MKYRVITVNTCPSDFPRIYVDGCYDLFHWGHMNAIRQARSLFDGRCVVVVGLVTNRAIEEQKGRTVFSEDERVLAVSSCQWVDEVVCGIAAWDTTVALMDALHIDVVVHGGDVSLNAATGRNSYQEVIDRGMFRTVPRTDGVSTTNLINRILGTVRDEPLAPWSFRSTTVAAFQREKRPTQSDDHVVYVDGAFDILRLGKAADPQTRGTTGCSATRARPAPAPSSGSGPTTTSDASRARGSQS